MSSSNTKSLLAGTLCLATLGASIVFYAHYKKKERIDTLLLDLLGDSPQNEAVIEIIVQNPDADEYNISPEEIIEVPLGLILECKILKSLVEENHAVNEEGLIDLLINGHLHPVDASDIIDFASLVQLTYWHDRRQGSSPLERVRRREQKYGRWTAKIPREQIIYSAVALKSDLRNHLGATVFRRPQGIDICRLSTLKRGAKASGNDNLLELVHSVMEKLKPENCVRIPKEEIKKHNTKEDAWIIIDQKVYDVTGFLDIHPGGDELIVESANGEDQTLKFEETHGEGLRYSLRLLNQFFIGFVENPDAVVGPSVDFLEVLREITGALHNFDDDRATGELQRKYGHNNEAGRT